MEDRGLEINDLHSHAATAQITVFNHENSGNVLQIFSKSKSRWV